MVVEMCRLDVVFAGVLDVELGIECGEEGGFWLFYPQVWEGIEL